MLRLFGRPDQHKDPANLLPTGCKLNDCKPKVNGQVSNKQSSSNQQAPILDTFLSDQSLTEDITNPDLPHVNFYI